MVAQVPSNNATSMTLEGVTVVVKVDSQEAPVYKAERTVVPKGMKAHIESVEGKRFTVHVKSSYGGDLAANLVIDGEKMSSLSLNQKHAPERWADFMGKRDSSTTSRPFVFQPLSLTASPWLVSSSMHADRLCAQDDVDIAINDEAIVKNMGSIKLNICRIVLGSSYADPGRTYAPNANKVIHEKSKKATLSHAAGLGAAEAVPSQTYSHAQWIDGLDNPWMTFEFAYRSRDLLEIGEIVPTQALVPAAGPSNTANQAGKKRAATGVIIIDSDDDSDEESPERELERLRKENAAFKKVKSEPKVKAEKGVKKEPKPSAGGKQKERIVIDIDD